HTAAAAADGRLRTPVSGFRRVRHRAGTGGGPVPGRVPPLVVGVTIGFGSRRSGLRSGVRRRPRSRVELPALRRRRLAGGAHATGSSAGNGSRYGSAGDAPSKRSSPALGTDSRPPRIGKLPVLSGGMRLSSGLAR